MGVKRTHCLRGHEFTSDNVYKNPNTGQRYCKKCKLAAQQKTVNKIKNAEGVKNWHLRIRYGLTPEQYEKMVRDSEGKCAICRKSFEKLFVDHDHSTKKVRELLCRHCNSGLGMFGDSEEFLLRAVAYLRKHA
jgi:Recombination endonuclease VII